MEKEMEGIYVGTVARELESNIEILRRETKPLLQAIFLSTSSLLIQRKNVMVMTVIVMKMVTTKYK